jgi:hypothetical protein
MFLALGPIGTPELAVLAVLFGVIVALGTRKYCRMKTTRNDESVEGRLKEVGGWLSLFCIALTIVGPFQAISSLSETRGAISQNGNNLPALTSILIIWQALDLIVMAVGFYAGVCLINIRPAAVRIAKNYLLLHLVNLAITPLLVLLLLPRDVGDSVFYEFLKGSMHGLLFFIVWYLYLIKSKRVKATYAQ